MNRILPVIILGCMLVAASTALAQDNTKSRAKQVITFGVHRADLSPDVPTTLSGRKITIAPLLQTRYVREAVSLRTLSLRSFHASISTVTGLSSRFPSGRVLVTISD